MMIDKIDNEAVNKILQEHEASLKTSFEKIGLRLTGMEVGGAFEITDDILGIECYFQVMDLMSN